MAFWNRKKKKHKSALREWFDAAIFAVVVATLIRTFMFEAYTIPTPSMEKSLMVHDFLFVSKMHYGPRIPMTPLSFPFVHNIMPVVGGKSYSTAVQWDYKRIGGRENKIKRYDDVVFNFPGDMVDDRPVDKKDNYIKRCMGLPGDSLEIRNRVVYVNGEKAFKPKYQQFTYRVSSATGAINQEIFDELHIYPNTDDRGNVYPGIYSLTDGDVEELRKIPNIQISLLDTTVAEPVRPGVRELRCFPNTIPGFSVDTSLNWNHSNYGPIYIPERGKTITLTPQNIRTYITIIQKYEKHELTWDGTNFIIDGKVSNEYTFEMNYYWMMGDNRHNSLDSRFWGFVPEDHIVGKAWFVWMSYGQEGIRWNRLFRSIKALED